MRVLTADQLDRIAIVLVRARNPNNIGAVARAMHDFGFRDLRLVNEFTVPLEAARSAVDASEVLHGASEFASVAAAVADCTMVYGTTAVGERDLEHRLESLAEAAVAITTELAQSAGMQTQGEVEGTPQPSRVALLFGSEKTGLSNEELSHCNALLTIPMQRYAEQRHPSMNLGQAVAVCLYELVRERPVGHVGRVSAMADAAMQERLTALWQQTLTESEYTRHHPANTAEADVRRLVQRLHVDATDAPVWLGILRQMLWKLKGGASRTDF